MALLSESALRIQLGERLRFFHRCDSTNAEALKLSLEGAESGTIVVAEQQEAGRGRMGRTWLSAPGENLTFSLLLRPDLPPERFPLLCLATAVGITEVCASLGAPASIKWPNDVVDAQGFKLAGVLAEVSQDAVIIGVGLNVNQRKFPPELPNARSLRQHIGERDRAVLLRRLLPSIEGRCKQLSTEPEVVLNAWRRRSSTIGRRVRVAGLCGVAIGLRGDGALLIDTANGVRPILTGDVEMLSGLG